MLLTVKKYFILCALLLPLFAFADRVSVERARAVAERQLKCGATRVAQAVDLKLVCDGFASKTRTDAEPAFYVFNNQRGRGFVVVSGDDSVMPVLGYSFTDNFPQNPEMLPANVCYWLGELERQVDYLRAHDIRPSDATQKAWRATRI